MTPLRSLLAVLTLSLAATSAGCGGGGGSPVPSDAADLLDGNYLLWYLVANDDVVDRGGTIWGTLVADGMGALAGTVTENDEGVVSGPSALGGTYTVAGDRNTSLDFGTLVTFAGWTNAGGTMVATGSVTPGSDPVSLALLKLGTGFSNASLNGDYHFNGFGVTVNGTTAGHFGKANFDGAGSIAFNTGVNTEGTITPPSASVGTYTVAADGQVTLTRNGFTYAGSILPGGGLVLVAGPTQNTSDPAAFAFLPVSSGATNAQLSGTYQIIGIERDGTGYTSLSGAVVADGAGALTATFTRNSDGTVTGSGPDVVSFSVAADGTLTVDPTGDMILGGVSPSGDYAIIGGPTGTGTGPSLYILMRR